MTAKRGRFIALGIALAALALTLGACGDDDSADYPPITATTTPTPPTNSLQYNFSGIEGAVSAIQGSVSTIQGLLDQGGQCVQKLAPIWGGTGSDAYLLTQQRWDSAAAELNSALKDLADKVAQAGSSMQDTEQGAGGMFSYSFASAGTPVSFQTQTLDAQALSAAATAFDSISSELKSAIDQVDSTAGDLAGSLLGPAGDAAQAAFARFRDAANKQIQLLNTISENINQAGVQYQQAADDAGSSLQDSMGF